MPILTTKLPDWHIDVRQAVRSAAHARGISSAQIAMEIVRLRLGRQKLSWRDYFLFGAHRPSHSEATRAEFIGDRIQTALNFGLAPSPSLHGLITDKLLTDLFLTRSGLAVAPIRALAVAVDAYSPYPILKSPAELDRFLAQTPLPVFGKPVHGSRSLAAISIVDRAGENVELGDGRHVVRKELVAEIFRNFPKGYLFQDLVLPHPDLARIIGPVIGTVRVVTLRIGKDIVPLYAALKMPGAGQMVDDLVSFTSTLCAVDHRDGRILRGQDRRKFGGINLVANPVTGMELEGVQVPLWPEVMTLAHKAHSLLHRQGIVGGDYAITESGPLIVELNDNPRHAMYQKSQARGFWNPEIAPLLVRALAEFGHRSKTRTLPYP
jgi:Sugar-transfer associated ATP-grasp